MKPIGLYMIFDPSETGLSLEEMFRFYAEIGFDFVCTSPARIFTTDFMALAEKYCLPIDNVHLSGPDTNPLWQEGARGDEIVQRYCDEITEMTARGIHLGVAHETWGHPEMPLNDLGLSRIGRIISWAEKKQFVIGFENSITPDVHLRAVLDRFDSPSARFTFDTGHWNAFAPKSNFPFEYADRLVITHIQDNDGSGDQHRIPFDGTVDYARLAPVLRHAKRLTFECAARSKNPALYGNMTYFEHIERLYHAARRIAQLVGD